MFYEESILFRQKAPASIGGAFTLYL